MGGIDSLPNLCVGYPEMPQANPLCFIKKIYPCFVFLDTFLVRQGIITHYLTHLIQAVPDILIYRDNIITDRMGNVNGRYATTANEDGQECDCL